MAERNYDHIAINSYYLEPPARAALDAGKVTLDQAFAYSTSISSKRIANLMENAEKFQADARRYRWLKMESSPGAQSQVMQGTRWDEWDQKIDKYISEE